MARKPTRKPTKASVKAAAERAEKRAKGEEVAPPADPVMAPAETSPRRKVGRPSTYDDEYCDLVIELGDQGKSRTQIARTLGTTRQRLLEWEKAHPEFRDAMSIASEYSQAWWEDQGQVGLGLGRDFNGFVYSFQMKNRFKADYSEKFEVKHDATTAFAQCWQVIGTGAAGKVGAP